jgi:hypothetical protein
MRICQSPMLCGFLFFRRHPEEAVATKDLLNVVAISGIAKKSRSLATM